MQTTKTSNSAHTVVALDVGERRVGVAVASWQARLPRPLLTLERGPHFWDELDKLITAEAVNTIVIGLPRGLEGRETAQTKATRHFMDEVSERYPALTLASQDEAVTSRQAEAELQKRGKPFARGDIDALAATYILEDYLQRSTV